MFREISADPKLTLQTLAKPVKTLEDYERLCLKDSELAFKAMEFGTLKYEGQVRMRPVYGNSELSDTPKSQSRFSGQQENDSVTD